MGDIIDTFVEKLGLTADKKMAVLLDLRKISIGELLVDASSKLELEENKKFSELLDKGDMTFLADIRKKYSDDEWNQFVDKKIIPLLDDYLKNVVL